MEFLSAETQKFVSSRLAVEWGDARAEHSSGQLTKGELETSRLELARMLEVEARGIFFCSGISEANNIVVKYVADLKPSAIISSPFEPSSLLVPLGDVADKHDIPLLFVPTNHESGVDLHYLKKMIEQNPRSFISLSLVNRFTGCLLPVSRIAKYAHKYDCFFHSDISHSLGRFVVKSSNTNLDLMTAGAEFFGGLRGAGFVASNSPDFSPKSVITGVSCEYGAAAGQENILAISTMIFALKKLTESIEANFEQAKQLKKLLHEQLLSCGIEFTSVAFAEEHFSPYIIPLALSRIGDYKRLIVNLDVNDDICLSYFHKPFIKEMPDFLRISFSSGNTKRTDIITLVEALAGYEK